MNTGRMDAIMVWELRQSESNPVDRYGLGAFLKRLEAAEAGHEGRLEGFTFLQRWPEMLRFTRQIEDDLLESGARGPLYVGFQNADKLAGETRRYRRLRAHGIAIKAYGEGSPKAGDEDGLEQWCRLERNHARLENQWFLVSMTPNPIAFVGWEVSDEALWGRLGVSAEGKQFTGFVSDDTRVVASIIRHLDRLGTSTEAAVRGTPATVSAVIEQAHPTRVLALVDDGRRSFLRRSLAETAAACARIGAPLYLYDLAAASYLTDPYPDENEERWQHPLGAANLRAFGRGYLADLLEQTQQQNAATSALLPYGVGFGHLAKWCDEQAIDLVVLPVEYMHGSLLQRLQGYTLETLRAKAHVAIVIDDPRDGASLVPATEPALAVAAGR